MVIVARHTRCSGVFNETSQLLKRKWIRRCFYEGFKKAISIECTYNLTTLSFSKSIVERSNRLSNDRRMAVSSSSQGNSLATFGKFRRKKIQAKIDAWAVHH